MKIISDKKERWMVIEFDETELQALANFIGPTSSDDRTKRWKMSLKESNSLSELYSLLHDNNIKLQDFSVNPLKGIK